MEFNNSLKEAISLSQQILKYEEKVCSNCGSEDIQVKLIVTKKGWSYDNEWPVNCLKCNSNINIMSKNTYNDINTIKTLNNKL